LFLFLFFCFEENRPVTFFLALAGDLVMMMMMLMMNKWVNE